ncbi:hypothetical protein D9M68_700740 [compost metagenome]
MGEVTSPYLSAKLRIEPYDSAYRISTSAKASSLTRNHCTRCRSGRPMVTFARSIVPTSAMP